MLGGQSRSSSIIIVPGHLPGLKLGAAFRTGTIERVQLLALTAEGVRGFSAAAQVELPTGYTVLLPPSPGGTPLAALIIALLFPDGRGGEAAYLTPGGQSGTATLMLRGEDQRTYYLARHLGGPGALHRLNEGNGQWDLVTEDSQEIADYLRAELGLPPKSTFEQGFTLAAQQFPSEHGTGNAVIPPVGNSQAAHAKLSQLAKELEASQRVEQLHYKLDAITSQLSEVASKLAEGARLKAALREAEQVWAAAPTPEALNLPKDIVERAQRFPQLLAKRDAALSQLEQDLATEASVRASVAPLKRSPKFWAGIVVGISFFVLGVALNGVGRYLALLDIPAFGFAALVALRYIDELEQVDRQTRKGERLAAREKKLLEDFEVEAQWVKKAMHALGTESPAGLVEILSQKAKLAERAQELRRQLEAMEKDAYYASLVSKEQELRREHAALEGTLNKKGGFVREAGDVEREIKWVQRSLESADTEQAEVTLAATPDPMPVFLSLAADLLLVDAQSAGSLLRDRWTQLFASLTGRRYSGIELEGAGSAWAIASTGRVAASQLPGRDFDLFYLAARVALIEKCASRAKMPVLVESLPATLGGQVQPLIARILKQLGTLTQVLHVCPDAEMAGMADASVRL